MLMSISWMALCLLLSLGNLLVAIECNHSCSVTTSMNYSCLPSRSSLFASSVSVMGAAMALCGVWKSVASSHVVVDDSHICTASLNTCAKAFHSHIDLFLLKYLEWDPNRSACDEDIHAFWSALGVHPHMVAQLVFMQFCFRTHMCAKRT